MQKHINQQEFSTIQRKLLSYLWIKNSDFSKYCKNLLFRAGSWIYLLGTTCRKMLKENKRNWKTYLKIIN